MRKRNVDSKLHFKFDLMRTVLGAAQEGTIRMVEWNSAGFVFYPNCWICLLPESKYTRG